MFLITGANGLFFHGPLEELQRIDRIEPLCRAKRALADGADDSLNTPGSIGHGTRQAAVATYRAQVAAGAPRGRIYHAHQVMTREVVTVSEDTPVETAWRTLATRGVRQAPVVNAAKCLVGLVTREHLLRVINEAEGQIRDVVPCTVRDVMATPVVAAESVTDIRRIARVMVEHALSAVPILDDSSAIVGIVSRHDILKVVAIDPPLMLWA